MRQPFYTIDTHLIQEFTNLYTSNHQYKLQSPLHNTTKAPQSEILDLVSNFTRGSVKSRTMTMCVYGTRTTIYSPINKNKYHKTASLLMISPQKLISLIK